MAFENLTLFELHLENSRFGPSFGDDDEETAAESYESADDESGRGGRMRPLGVLLFLVVVGLAARRYRSKRSAGEDGGDDAEQITIEHATEQ